MTELDERALIEHLLGTAAQLVPPVARRQAGLRYKAGQADNWVTDTDLRIEHYLRSELARLCPADAVVGEELGGQAGVQRTWYLDPVDGTQMFARGLPLWSIQLVVCDPQGPLAAGMLFPDLGQCYLAGRGRGLWLNRVWLDPRARPRRSGLERCAAGGVDWRGIGDQRWAAVMHTLRAEVSSLRPLGCASLSLAWTAAGHLDLCFYEHTRAGLHDYLPGMLACQEMGLQAELLPPREDGCGRMLAALPEDFVSLRQQLLA